MADAKGNKRPLARKTLLALASAATSLVCAEACVRLLYRDQVDTELMMARLRAASIKDIKQPSEDPILYFELRPNVRTQIRDSSLIIGPDGYRVPSQQVNVPANAVRVAVVGDSSSFGWGVNYEDSYPDVYRRLMEAATQTPIALRNFSVPAYNTEQELQVFKTKALPYKPDLLILHHDHNDVAPRLGFRGSGGLHPTYGDNLVHSALIKLALRKLSIYRSSKDPQSIAAEHERVGPYITAGPWYDKHLQALRELAEESRSHGIPTIVVLFNAYVEADSDYETSPQYIELHRKLSEALRTMGLHVLDLYPMYQAHMRQTGWADLRKWWISKDEPMDPHPNVSAHRFIAEALVAHTRRQPELMSAFRRR